MTVQDVFEMALALIDQTGAADNEDYAARAPEIADVLQKEMAFYEKRTVTRKLKSMDDTLEISEDSAERIMPYGLAASFALADKNGDMYADYSGMYRALCRTIRQDETDTEDSYGVLRGMG